MIAPKGGIPLKLEEVAAHAKRQTQEHFSIFDLLGSV